jgi:hypothetical protein
MPMHLVIGLVACKKGPPPKPGPCVKGDQRRALTLRASARRGAERDRTVGLLNAIEALSQLSYSPDTGFPARE